MSSIPRILELLCGIQLQRDIIPRVQYLNSFSIPCSFSYLPIVSYTEHEVDNTLKEYKNLVDGVAAQNRITGLTNDITIKLYQFGQYRFPELCHKVITELVSYARERSIFLWFDTSDRVLYEGRNLIDETITLFEYIYKEIKRGGGEPLLGICVQSYHQRTDTDMEYLIAKGYRVRLVKGFYADGDIPVWSAVTEHYVSLAKRFLLHPNLVLLALASHDKRMIGELLNFVDEHNIAFEKFSIQGFWGIQDQYYIDLKEKGYKVKIYIPYGNFLQFVWRGAKWMDRKRIMRRILGMKVI